MLRSRARLMSLALACAHAASGCYFYARDTTGDPDGVFTTREYAFSGPEEFRTKGVPGSPHAKPVLGLRNQGSVSHELRAMSVGDLSPGNAVTAHLKLAEGNYALLCRFADAEGASHASKGMLTGFTAN